MAKITFADVGRGKWNGEIEIPENCGAETVAEYAHREAEKHLASRFPDTEYNQETNEGKIFAGFHCVGSFRVI